MRDSDESWEQAIKMNREHSKRTSVFVYASCFIRAAYLQFAERSEEAGTFMLAAAAASLDQRPKAWPFQVVKISQGTETVAGA